MLTCTAQPLATASARAWRTAANTSSSKPRAWNAERSVRRGNAIADKMPSATITAIRPHGVKPAWLHQIAGREDGMGRLAKSPESRVGHEYASQCLSWWQT